MPYGVRDDEDVLHVPIDEDLLEEFKRQAKRLRIPIKAAAADALRIWTGYQEYREKEENRNEVAG